MVDWECCIGYGRMYSLRRFLIRTCYFCNGLNTASDSNNVTSHIHALHRI